MTIMPLDSAVPKNGGAPTMHALIDKKTGQELKLGDIVADSKQQEWTLCGFTPAKHAASPGRVHLQSRDGNATPADFHPTAIGATIVRVPRHLEYAFGINEPKRASEARST